MNSGNPYKNILQNGFDLFIEIFLNINKENHLNDQEMECMHFGICSHETKNIKEIPFFHF